MVNINTNIIHLLKNINLGMYASHWKNKIKRIYKYTKRVLVCLSLRNARNVKFLSVVLLINFDHKVLSTIIINNYTLSKLYYCPRTLAKIL